MSGRKRDSVWQHFIEKSNKLKGKAGSRAVCKYCKEEIQGLVQRLKAHREKCQKKQMHMNEVTECNTEDTDTDSNPTTIETSQPKEFFDPQPSTSRMDTNTNISSPPAKKKKKK